MGQRTIGTQELALLRYLLERADATVGEVAEGFGCRRGLARSTVLTMMERLRRKGYLSRRPVKGVYRYRARNSPAELQRGLIRRFVDKSLGGSVAPFVAYLSETDALTDDEIRKLEDIVARLQEKRCKGGGE